MNGKKLSAGAIGVPAAVVIVWGLDIFAGIKAGPEVAAAFGAICTFVASLCIPDAQEE